MPLNKTLAAFALGLTSTFSSGTAALANWSNGALYIGQDTLGNAKADAVSGHRCKMFVSDRYVLTTAGAVSAMAHDKSGKPTIIRDYFRAGARAVLAKGGNPNQVIDALINATKQSLEEVMSSFPEKIRKDMMTSSHGSTGTLFWFDGFTPMSTHFFVKPVMKEGSSNFEVMKDPSPQVISVEWVEIQGTFHKVTNDQLFLKSLETLPNSLDRLKSALTKESDLSKKDVGPPFTIYRLSPIGGSSWVENGDFCKDNTVTSEKPHS